MIRHAGPIDLVTNNIIGFYYKQNVIDLFTTVILVTCVHISISDEVSLIFYLNHYHRYLTLFTK